MALEEYQRKRDLTRTPEPGGRPRKSEKVLRFVIHKHAASHLHYDFRLEMEGVLKSWAIPKGPSLDPSIKRLAMMVEDHPYEYGGFEGIIPKGNYGAGEVIIWDQGSYRSSQAGAGEESEALLREGLRKGDLKFILEGEKLKGEFALVRIKSEKENTWLLMKKKDQFASMEDVTLLDRSVVSNVTIEDLKQGRFTAPAPFTPTEALTPPPATPVEEPAPAPASEAGTAPSPAGGVQRSEEKVPPQSKRSRASRSAPSDSQPPKAKPEPAVHKEESLQDAPPAPMPHEVQPMLASSAKEPFDDPDWLFEIKLDGFRCIAELEKGNVLIYSRNNLPFNQRFPGVVEALRSIGRDAVLDGEIVALDENGRSWFQLLQNNQRTGEGNIAYFVFDILYLDGKDLRALPLTSRKEILRELLPELFNVNYSDHILEYGKEFFEAAKANSLEGILAKRSNSPYFTGRRTKDWLKIKIRLQQEAVICGFTEPRGSRKSFGSVVLGVYENDELTYIGLTGGGFDEASIRVLYALLEPLVQEVSPFKERVKTDMPVKWVRPELVCEVEFAEWTDERVMRQPIFLGLREDKDPRLVVREEFSSKVLPEAEPGGEGERKRSKKTAPKKGSEIVVIEGNRLELTNLDKVFWPEEGYTKRDLIEYYRTVAHCMLPHLLDRPESLYRTPHGITGEGFFQKEAGELPPPWIQTEEIYSKHVDKTIKFFLCQDEATLVFMANLGCIEINPWLSRIQSLNNPDYFVIDLDPEDIPFEKVIEAALAVHEVLERAGAVSYPKTSGATGIHIYVPLGAKYDYEAAQKFAHVIATLVHHKVPDFTSLLRSPKQRQQKVYLDFLQNKAGATLAAPYSVRPKPGATVSTPLKWEEVRPGLSPSLFTIRNMPARIEQVGDLFQGVLGPGVDLEKCIESLEKSGG
jgi:bifunctional non-homologous end joining protein LigD